MVSFETFLDRGFFWVVEHELTDPVRTQLVVYVVPLLPVSVALDALISRSLCLRAWRLTVPAISIINIVIVFMTTE